MKIAIVSDIHANFEALEAVLEDLEQRVVDRKVCLGDIVGYGAEPVECVERVKDEFDIVVTGNHELGSLFPNVSRDITFNGITRFQEGTFRSKSANSFTNLKLKSNHDIFVYLLGLPKIVTEDGITYVHACPIPGLQTDVYFRVNMIERYLGLFEVTYDVFRDSLYGSFEKLCFIGHTHIPGVLIRQGENELLKHVNEGEFKFDLGQQYLVNVGSVGQPRDEDPTSCYVVYDSVANSVEFVRVVYKIGKAQTKILDAGLPKMFATRLSEGT